MPSPSAPFLNARETFGPPGGVEKILKHISRDAKKALAHVHGALSLPFVDELKVIGKDGEETNMAAVVIECGASVLNLHTHNLSIRELLAYSDVQLILLPMVNTELTVSAFVQTDLPLATENEEKVAASKSDLQAIFLSLEGVAEGLNKELEQVQEQITANTAALAEAQREYDAARATVLIKQWAAALYTGAALIALAEGQSRLAFDLLGGTYRSFNQGMEALVDAGKLFRVVAHLEENLKTTKKTYKYLQELVKLLHANVESVKQLENVWKHIIRNLNGLRSSIDVWTKKDVIDSDSIQDAMEAWKAVKVACEEYYKTLAD